MKERNEINSGGIVSSTGIVSSAGFVGSAGLDCVCGCSCTGTGNAISLSEAKKEELVQAIEKAINPYCFVGAIDASNGEHKRYTKIK